MADGVDRPMYCQVCGEGGKRYRCPRCFIETCSLKCVKQHKIDRDCNGVRNKTGMVPLKEFTDLHLLSDFRFIEDASRCVDTAERNVSKVYGIAYWTGQLLRQCRYRKINLQVLPEKFSKRLKNTTKYMQNLKKIFWHVEWKFAESNFSLDDSSSERVTLRNALSKYFDQNSTDYDIRHRLKPYKCGDFEQIVVIMKLEHRPANSPLYTRLNLDKSICDNLREQIVIEYPTFIVILKENLRNYPLDDRSLSQNELNESGEIDLSPENSDQESEITTNNVINQNIICNTEEKPENEIAQLHENNLIE